MGLVTVTILKNTQFSFDIPFLQIVLLFDNMSIVTVNIMLWKKKNEKISPFSWDQKGHCMA